MIFVRVFLEFFKIGAVTFGGGQAMLPILQRELVTNLNWLSMDKFLYFVSVSEVTPGPVALNMATFIGFEMKGIVGAITATAGVVAPSFIIILLIASFAHRFRENKIYKRFMSGIKPVIIALLANAIYLITLKGFKGPIPYLMAGGAFFLFYKWKLNPVILLLIMGALGILIL
ncbi:MAG: chromate transporter [Caldisericaceae bacterium]